MGKQGPKKIRSETILVIGLTLTLLAALIWSLEQTAKNTTKLSATAGTLLKEPTVQTELAQSINDALQAQSSVGTLEANNVEALSRATVAQPQMETAFRAAIVAMHTHLFDGASGKIPLDRRTILAAIHSAEVAGAPSVPIPPNFTVAIDADALPDIHGAMARMVNVMQLFALLGLALIGIGIVTSRHRGRSMMRVGRWMLVAGLVAVFVFWLLPQVILEHMGSWGAIVGILLATGDNLIVPGAALAIAGGGVILVGHAVDDSSRKKTLRAIPQVAGRRTIANNWEAPVA